MAYLFKSVNKCINANISIIQQYTSINKKSINKIVIVFKFMPYWSWNFHFCLFDPYIPYDPTLPIILIHKQHIRLLLFNVMRVRLFRVPHAFRYPKYIIVYTLPFVSKMFECSLYRYICALMKLSRRQ